MVDRILKVVAAGCGISALGGAYYFTEKHQALFRKEEFYTRPMELLRNYPPAVERLGQPITTKRLKLENANELFIDGLNAKLKIPLKGPKDKGYLYVLASRKVAGESWHVDELDLEIKSSGKRWTFYKPIDSSET